MSYSERGRRRRSRGPSTIGASENWLRVPDQRIETSMGMAPNADVRTGFDRAISDGPGTSPGSRPETPVSRRMS
jgi:hypothetical protein